MRKTTLASFPPFDICLADGRILACSFEFSTRAKRVLLKFSTQKGLRMIWPTIKKPDEREARRILEALHPWIERQAAKKLQPSPPPKEIAVPTSVALAYSGEVWPIIYNETANTRSTLAIKDGVLLFSGPDNKLVASALQKWLFAMGKLYLPAATAQLAAEMGFKFKTIRIKRQKTRWGSCSSCGSINLNFRLMLLPKKMAHYVIVHELCHLQHMNHGPDFYALLSAYYPQWRQFDRDLRTLERDLPAWSAPT